MTPRVRDALARLKAVFRKTARRELTVTDAAILTGLDEEVCHRLLRDLVDTGFIEQRRHGVFVAGRL